MPRKSPYEIVLSRKERLLLVKVARSYRAAHCDVTRAKAILLAADRLSNEQIAQRVDMSRQSVSKWRDRFFHERLAGLSDHRRSGRRRSFPPEGGGGGQSDGL